MKLTSDSFPDEGSIPPKYAFGKPDPDTHITFSSNMNPHLQWSEVPEGTRSFALICVDPDAPADPSDANQEGKSLAADLPRQDFYHWVLVDVPADRREIVEGAASKQVTPRGKPTDATPLGRAGRNSYTEWFAGDKDMDGVYGGYDGPGPPFNDERVHHYHFRLYALDVDRLELPDEFDGDAAREAMRSHVLDEAEWTGTYSLNPELHAG